MPSPVLAVRVPRVGGGRAFCVVLGGKLVGGSESVDRRFVVEGWKTRGREGLGLEGGVKVV